MLLEMDIPAPAETLAIVPVHRMGALILKALRWIYSGPQARVNNFVSRAILSSQRASFHDSNIWE